MATHCRTAPRQIFTQRYKKIYVTSKSLVERLFDFEVYVLSVLGCIGSISAPDEATLKEESYALQCTTAGPYNALPTRLLHAGFVRGLGISPVLLSDFAQLPVPLHSQMALRKFGLPVNLTMLFFELTRLCMGREVSGKINGLQPNGSL